MNELGKYQLPKGWAWATIPDITGKEGVFIDGDWVESKDQDPGGDVRLIQLADVGDGVYRDKSNRFMTKGKADALNCTFLKENDVLIARMPDPLGRACLFPGDEKPSVTVVDVAIVRSGNGEFDHRWLACFVNAHPFRSAIFGLQAGSTRKRISRGNLATIPLPVPPLSEQRQIVAEIEKQFTRLEAGVSALKRVQANLKRYRAAVLKAACADWPERPLSDVCDVVSGYAFKSSDFCGTGIPVIKIANVSYGLYLNVAPSFLPRTFIKEFRRFQIQTGDILLALTRPITNNQVKTCLYPQELSPALLNQRVAKIAPNEGVLRGYLLAFLRSEHFKSAITAVMPQTLQPNLSPRDLAAMPIPLPPLAEQERIVAEVERRLSVVEELETVVAANLQRATRLRQSILKTAFTGYL